MSKILARILIILSFAGVVSLAWYGLAQIDGLQTLLAAGGGGEREHQAETGFSGPDLPFGETSTERAFAGGETIRRGRGSGGVDNGISLSRLLPGIGGSLLKISLGALLAALVLGGMKWIAKRMERGVAPEVSP